MLSKTVVAPSSSTRRTVSALFVDVCSALSAASRRATVCALLRLDHTVCDGVDDESAIATGRKIPVP